MLLALLIILVHQALTVVIHVEAMGACENVHDSRGAARVQQQWQCDAFVGCWADHVIDFILRERVSVRVGVSKLLDNDASHGPAMLHCTYLDICN